MHPCSHTGGVRGLHVMIEARENVGTNGPILFLGDDLHDRQVITQCVKQLSMEVVLVQGCRSAASALLSREPSVAILDLELLQRDATVLVSMLASNPHCMQLPLILIGNVTKIPELLQRQNRSVRLLHRPYYQDQLFILVREMLPLVDGAIELPQSNPPAMSPCTPQGKDHFCDETQLLRERLQRLPQLPLAALTRSRLLDLIDDANGLEVVAREAATDPGLVAATLRVVNTAYYRKLIGRPVGELREALVRIGLEEFRKLGLGHTLISALPWAARGLDRARFWKHSLLVANLLPVVYQLTSGSMVSKAAWNELYSVGLLHDLGILALATLEGERYSRVLATVGASTRHLHSVERELLGLSHDQAGGLLARQWRLPELFQTLLAAHHETPVPDGRYSPQLKALCLCDGLCRYVDAGPHTSHQLDLWRLHRLSERHPTMSRLVEDLLPRELQRSNSLIDMLG